MTLFAKAAALAAAAFFCAVASCAPARESPGYEAPVFFYSGSMYEAATNSHPSRLFTGTAPYRARAVSSFEGDIIAWSPNRSRVEVMNRAGKLKYSVKLEAAFVYVSGNALLARSALFDENKGFEFTLYRLEKKKLVKKWSHFLDCFPSDMLFTESDTVYLAGGNREDTRNRLFKLEGKKAETLLDEAKGNGFLRLIRTGENLVVFRSGKDKSTGDLSVTVISPTASHTLTPEGLPKDAAAWFGYGFAFNGEPVLPLALLDGDIALVRLSISDYGVLHALSGSRGSFVPLGPSESGSAYYYLAHDALSNPALFSLASYDGLTSAFYPLP